MSERARGLEYVERVGKSVAASQVGGEEVHVGFVDREALDADMSEEGVASEYPCPRERARCTRFDDQRRGAHKCGVCQARRGVCVATDNGGLRLAQRCLDAPKTVNTLPVRRAEMFERTDE